MIKQKPNTLKELIDSKEITFVYESIGTGSRSKLLETSFSKRYKKMIRSYSKATIEAVIPNNIKDLDGDSSTFTIGYNEGISDVEQRAKKWLGE